MVRDKCQTVGWWAYIGPIPEMPDSDWIKVTPENCHLHLGKRCRFWEGDVMKDGVLVGMEFVHGSVVAFRNGTAGDRSLYNTCQVEREKA